MNKENNKLSDEIISTYRIQIFNEEMLINNNTFINIESPYKISESESCFTIRNDKVSVSLWKGIRLMHITVL